LYEEHPRANIGEVIAISSFFNRFVNEKKNESLMERK
jgi:hypothetical protein